MAGDARNKRRLPANVDNLDWDWFAGLVSGHTQCDRKRRTDRNRGFPASNRQDRFQNRARIN